MSRRWIQDLCKKEDKKLINKIISSLAKLQEMDKELENFVKFAETKDDSYLAKEMERLKLKGKRTTKVEPNTLSTVKSTVPPQVIVTDYLTLPAASSSSRITRSSTRQKKQAQEKKTEEVAVEPPQPKKRNNKMKKGVKGKVGGKRSKYSSPSDKDENNSNYEDAVSNFDPSELYEDAVSNFDPSEQAPVMNATMAVEKPKVVKQIEDKHESENYRTLSPTKKGQIKEIFNPSSPFESSSNILESASITPIREDANTDPEKSKQYAPFTNKFMPKTTSTSLKINRFVSCNSTSKVTSVSMKFLSTPEASLPKYREEKRIQEKGKEAQLKKEAMLLVQAEETKRKREEKHLKAQQQRAVIQKLKEEKYKQAVAEKEEKLQKMKEEAEKKRLLATNQAKAAKESQSAKEKAIENEINLDKGKTKRDQNDNEPLDLTTRPPLLLTDDFFDSDDEEYRN